MPLPITAIIFDMGDHYLIEVHNNEGHTVGTKRVTYLSDVGKFLRAHGV